MPSSYLQGIQGVFDNQAQIRNDISVVAINWFVNRCPLVTRIPRVPVASQTFSMIGRSFRSRSAVLANAITAVDTQITLADAGMLMNGDVLELPSGEHVELVADPVPATGVVNVRRAVEGTTAAAAAAGANLLLIGNSRTGAEVDQNAVAYKPTSILQYCQTFQHPVQIGGSLQSSSGFELATGARSPLDQYKMDALQNLMDDVETSAYYGLGEAPSATARPKQKGLRSLIANKVTAPANAALYKPTDLVRDTLEKARLGGGDPDVLLLSTNFMTGLATWGQAIQRLDAGVNVFGTPISVFEAPFLGGLSIIEAPLLRPYTAVALTSSEVRMRFKRNEFWSPRGNRGDAIEGDWIAECAIEIDNPTHHAWLEGITGFSA